MSGHRTTRGLAAAGLIATGGLASCLGPEVVVTASVAAAEAGSSSFIRGELVQSHKAPLEQIAEAGRRAIRSLELRAGTDRAGDSSIFLMAHERGGREIAIRFEEVSPVVTRVKIRIGIWGEQSLSRLVMTEIESQLEAPSDPAPAAR